MLCLLINLQVSRGLRTFFFFSNCNVYTLPARTYVHHNLHLVVEVRKLNSKKGQKEHGH